MNTTYKLLFAQLLLAALLHSVTGECSSNDSYECPYLSQICNETIYVDDCFECDGYLNTDSINNVCFDRKLLNGKDNADSSYLWRDIIGLVVWFVCAGVATACGVGGGGIYVPLGILLLNFAPKSSSGLSQASIFGASVGALILNARNKHPFTTKLVFGSDGNGAMSIPTKDARHESTETEKYYGRPLIDYDLSLYVAPVEMAGAVLGVMIQTMLPNWAYLLLAALILAFTAYKTYIQFFEARKKEMASRDVPHDSSPKKEPKEDKSAPCPLGDTSRHSLEETNDTNPVDPTEGSASQMQPNEAESVQVSTKSTSGTGMTEQEKLERRIYWLERESRQYPADKLIGLLVLWIGLILLTFFKGGKGVDSLIGIDCTSPWYAAMIAVQFAWTLGIAAFYGYQIMKEAQEKHDCDYPWHPHDIFWDFARIRYYGIASFIAGVVAGLIGIGGGMILGPIMLVMGVHPSVSSATNATMIVLTSSSIAVLFVTSGLVPWSYAVTFFIACLFGALLGKTKIDSYVKRTGKASILIFMLATIIALATLGCIAIALTRLADADWCFDGLHKFCSVSQDESESDVCVINRMLFGEPL